MSRSRCQRGQAATEYVGLLALVALVLAAAASAVAAPELAGVVLRQLRIGLCMAGGDVCRHADARAAGLEPCVRSSVEHSRTTGVTIAVARVGEGKGYAIERRSDGSLVVRASDDSTLSAVAGFGLGPVKAAGSASAGFGFRRGREWSFPDAASARRFLARIPDLFELTDDGDVNHYGGERAPVRYLEGGGQAGADLEAQLGGARGGLVIPGFSADARAAIGRRRDPEGTTLYYELSAETGGALGEAVPEIGRSGHWIAEWRVARPPVLTLRSRDGGRKHDTERIVRLALTRPGDRRAALELVLAPLSPALMTLTAGDLMRRVRERGTIERLTYEERRQAHGFDVTGRVGVSAGFDHVRTTIRRRLVAAEVVHGGRRVRRVDCVGSARS